MGIARYKDLCIDTPASRTLANFWAPTLGLRLDEADDPHDVGSLAGDAPSTRIWMNVVPEPKSAKHRVHLDVHCASIDELVARGATILEPAEEFGRGWTVLADPDGGEFCGFVRPPDRLPPYRLYELVVDSADPLAIGRWWAGVFGCPLERNDDEGWCWLEQVPGAPFEGWVFGGVPEPKTVKNRIHWDVVVESVDAIVAAGATVLRARDDEIRWTVCADPEGNEFCAFPLAPT